MLDQRLPRERRQHKRANLGQMVHFETQWGVLTATVPELSETGLRLDTPWLPPLNTDVAVLLRLADRQGKVNPCLVYGRVVRHLDEEEIGVAFTDLLPRHMLQLRDYVHRNDHYYGP